MLDVENRTPLPQASSAGCSCCSPAGRAPKAPSAVVIPAGEAPDADAPAPTPHHLPR